MVKEDILGQSRRPMALKQRDSLTLSCKLQYFHQKLQTGETKSMSPVTIADVCVLAILCLMSTDPSAEMPRGDSYMGIHPAMRIEETEMLMKMQRNLKFSCER
jgi:hypothetical protein